MLNGKSIKKDSSQQAKATDWQINLGYIWGKGNEIKVYKLTMVAGKRADETEALLATWSHVAKAKGGKGAAPTQPSKKTKAKSKRRKCTIPACFPPSLPLSVFLLRFSCLRNSFNVCFPSLSVCHMLNMSICHSHTGTHMLLLSVCMCVCCLAAS